MQPLPRGYFTSISQVWIDERERERTEGERRNKTPIPQIMHKDMQLGNHAAQGVRFPHCPLVSIMPHCMWDVHAVTASKPGELILR